MEAMIWAAEGLLGYTWKGYCARQRALLLIAGHGVTFLGVDKEQTFAAIGCGQPHAHLTIHREIIMETISGVNNVTSSEVLSSNKNQPFLSADFYQLIYRTNREAA